MALNSEKPNSILFGTSQCKQFLNDHDSVNVAGMVIPLAKHLKLLGVALDANLAFKN